MVKGWKLNPLLVERREKRLKERAARQISLAKLEAQLDRQRFDREFRAQINLIAIK